MGGGDAAAAIQALDDDDDDEIVLSLLAPAGDLDPRCGGTDGAVGLWFV